MHELFDHTADLGLRIRAADLNTLFAEAGECLLACMIDSPASVNAVQSEKVAIEGTDRDFLLFDWLRELLNRSDEARMLWCQFDVSVSSAGLEATIRGEPFDPARHQLSREVKAITYHGLKIEDVADGFLAEVIVDI
jgi:SHS2 domain-containing protein